MGLFENKYPYTDFHELNLDWFLEQFKGLVEDWDKFRTDMEAEWNNIKDDWNALYKYVHDYFDNLDVQTEINNKLDEMAADGTLDILIRGTDFMEELTLHPLAFYTNGLQCQGSQYVVDGDSRYLVIGFSAPNEANDRIVKLDLDTGFIVKNIEGNFGHCNGLCYADGKIYIARGGGNASTPNVINVIDFDTFDVLDDIYTERAIYAIAYNNGKFYGLSSVNDQKVYKFSESFDEEEVIDIEYRGGNAWQGMTVDDNYIYICSFRGSSNTGIDGIAVHFFNGKLKSFVKAPRNMEIEDVSVYGKNFIANVYTGGGCLVVSMKINQNPARLGRWSNTNDNSIATSDKSLSLYLDASYNGVLQDGTEAKPFNNYTALIMSCFYKGITTLTINVKGDFSNVNMTFADISFIRALSINGSDNAVLGSLCVYAGNIINVNNVKFVGLAHDARGSVSFRTCTMYINGCTFESENIGIYNESGIATITECSFIGNSTAIRGIRKADFNIGNNQTFTNVGTRTEIEMEYNVPHIKVVGFGDSIMAGTHTHSTFPSLFRDRIQCDMENLGVSGARYYAVQLGLMKQLQDAVNMTFDAGLIICGTNDYGNDVTEANFRQYVSDAFDYINEHYSDKPILVCTPFQRLNGDTPNARGLKLEDYVNIIKEIGAAKSIMIYDCFNDPAMNFINNTELCADGLHPLDKALKRIYPTLLNKII